MKCGQDRWGRTGRTNRGTMDSKWTQLKKCKESKWIIKLRTACQYGLHDRASDDVKSTNNETVGLNFPILKHIYVKMWGTNYVSCDNLNHIQFILKF